MTQPIPYPGNPPSAIQPQWFEELVPIAVGVMIMIAFAAWAFSLVRKALKGEEIARPF